MIFYQNVAEVLFLAFILLVIGGSFIVLRTKILMHTVLGLAVTLLGVAGIYFYLGSMFLALMQILIYVGAICIVLVFGIMVGYTPTEVAVKNIREKRNVFLAVSAAGAAFFLLIAGVLKTEWTSAATVGRYFSAAHVGRSFLYEYCLAFELISVILLVAIVGAIILARGTDKDGAAGEHDDATLKQGSQREGTPIGETEGERVSS
jgi:NADH:ubiquinone oxidoreductase subunit 6 (subunit J)